MMDLSATNATGRLYQLLPVIYRVRDAERGEALRALMAVFESVFTSLETDVAATNDDWFIETCHEDVVPLLGELVGAERLLDPDHMHGTRRRAVANTSSYRRRTGTLAAIENIALDLTGWHVLAVDVSRRVAKSQHVQHPRYGQGTLVDLHDRSALAWAGTALDSFAHTTDVHGVSPQVGSGGYRTGGVQGRYNLPNLAIYFWRLQSYSLLGTTPFGIGDGRYTFDPRGRDVPLFAEGRTAPHDLAPVWVNYPGPLLRRPIADELDERRRSMARGDLMLPPNAAPDFLAFAVWQQTRVADTRVDVRVPPERIVVRDLTDWPLPPESLSYPGSDGKPVKQAIDVAIDPTLGRITCQPAIQLEQVSFTYGFSGPLGGGAYDRQASLVRGRARVVTWQAFVRQTGADRDAFIFDSLDAAIEAWNAVPPGTAGRIAIGDNRTYVLAEARPPISIPAGSQLTLVAASCPAIDAEDPTPGSGGSSPPAPTNLQLADGTGLEVGRYRYQVTFVFGSPAAPVETGGSAESTPIVTTAGQRRVVLDVPTGPPGVAARNLYRTLVDGPSGSERFLASIEFNQPYSYTDYVSDRDLGGYVPAPAEVVGNGLRPCLRGALRVAGTARTDAPDPGEFLLNGVLLDGSLHVLDGNLGGLEVSHATLAPDAGGLVVEGGNALLDVRLESAIAGEVRLSTETPLLSVDQSVLDGEDGDALVASSGAVTIRASTVLGSTRVHSLKASDTIFTGSVNVERLQAGIVEASYVHPGSRTPPRHRCQPDLALAGVEDEAERDWIRARVAPTFNSLTYGQPGYAQLAPSTPIEIRTGATGEREMGAFFPLHQPLRMAHFLEVLDQHLPLGREVGVFFVT